MVSLSLSVHSSSSSVCCACGAMWLNLRRRWMPSMNAYHCWQHIWCSPIHTTFWLFLIRNWSYIATHRVLHILLALFPLVGAASSKKPTSPSFQIGAGWNLTGSFSSKYASIEGVGFSIWRHARCCHLVSAHAASARRICSSVRQFVICSTFVIILLIVWELLGPKYQTCSTSVR